MNTKQKVSTNKTMQNNTPVATTKANSTKQDANAANSSDEDVEMSDNEAV
jgi:hypothetical protein